MLFSSMAANEFLGTGKSSCEKISSVGSFRSSCILMLGMNSEELFTVISDDDDFSSVKYKRSCQKNLPSSCYILLLMEAI